MRSINFSLIADGDIGLVGSTSELGDLIKDFEYPKDFKGLELNHAFFNFRDPTQNIMLSEEAKLSGIVNSDMTDYLAGNDLIVLRKLVKPLTTQEAAKLMECVLLYTNKSHYRIGGLFTEAWRYLKQKANDKFGWNLKIDPAAYKYKDGTFVCSEWVGFALNYATGRFPDWKGKSPRDWQTDSRFTDSQIVKPV